MPNGSVDATASKTDQAYEILQKRILDGTYGPGYRLVVNVLGPELGMSPIPLREAIRRLEAEGWVVTRRYIGAEVAPADISHWAENMQALALLEAAATRLIAGRVTRADLAPAAAINAEMREAVRRSSVIDEHRLNREFHFALYALADNEPLVGFLGQTWNALARMRRSVSFYSARAPQSVDEHDQLLDMLVNASPQSPDVDAVERFARQHKERTLDVFFEQNPDLAARRGRRTDHAM